MHDLGKFIFAFSIFWTYIWFGQFLLIYYAHIPEETVYFVERMKNSPYSWIFYANLILNFVLPFLLLMTRDAKRQLSTLKLVCPIVLVGHWFDSGGFGTLDELLEAMTLVQTGKSRKIPIILVHSPFWKGLLDWFREQLAAEGMNHPEDLDLVQIIDKPEDVVDAIFKHYETRGFLPLPDEHELMLNL
jgi:hypothetical protein